MGRKYAHNKVVVTAATVLLCGTILSTILLASLSGANLINYAVTGSLLAAVGVGVVVFRHRLWFSPELSLFVLWIVVSLPSTIGAYHVEAALWKTFTLVQIALMVFAVQQTVIWSRRSTVFFRCFALGIVASYLLSYSGATAYELAQMDITGGHGWDKARIASTLADANMFGVTACLALTLVLMSCNRLASRAEVIGTGLLVTLLLVGVLHSGSRTALLGLAVVLVGAVYAYRLYRPSRLAGLGANGAIVAALLVVGLGLASQLESFQDKFESLFVDNDRVVARLEEFALVLSGQSALESEDGSISGRTQMMLDGLRIAGENPVFGVGLDNFRYVSGADTYAHSTPIELLVSTGIAGAAIYYMIYAVLLWRLLKLRRYPSVRPMVLTALFGVLAYTLMDVTHVSFSEKTSWVFLALVSATIEVERRALVRLRKKAKAKRSRSGKRRRQEHREHGLQLSAAD